MALDGRVLRGRLACSRLSACRVTGEARWGGGVLSVLDPVGGVAAAPAGAHQCVVGQPLRQAVRERCVSGRGDTSHLEVDHETCRVALTCRFSATRH